MKLRTKLTIFAAALAIAGAVVAHNASNSTSKTIPIKASKNTDGAFDHDHKALDKILNAHVKNERVDYKAIQAAPDKLKSYLGDLAAVSKAEFDSWNEQQQLAMLINLYNAATLNLIIDNYPVKSIKDIGGLFKKPWDLDSLSLFGKPMTLDHLEHGILRKDYEIPNIHFAIVCAAKGCPGLRSSAFTSRELYAEMKEQGEIFLRDSAKNSVDAKNKTVHLSKIFDWFKEDFTKKGTLIEFVRPFFSEGDAKALGNDFKIKYNSYDWSLNEQ